MTEPDQKPQHFDPEAVMRRLVADHPEPRHSGVVVDRFHAVAPLGGQMSSPATDW
jgi:hypothetical protein